MTRRAARRRARTMRNIAKGVGTALAFAYALALGVIIAWGMGSGL